MDATPSTLLPVISSIIPTVQTTAVDIAQTTAVDTAVTAAVVAYTALDRTEINILNQIVNIVQRQNVTNKNALFLSFILNLKPGTHPLENTVT